MRSDRTKVVHIFYSTLPSAKGGDIRSRDVVESQAEVGVDVLAVSSPFQPPAVPGESVEQFGGVSYYRTYSESDGLHISEKDQGLGVKLKKLGKIIPFVRYIRDLCAREKPDVIHAHSTFFCAAAAYFGGRRQGIPYVYEVRSLWEERSVMKSPTLKNKLVAKAAKTAETLAMRSADHLIVISEGLKHEALRRGVPEGKITIIGNAANLTRIPAVEPTYRSKSSSEWVFGYIGNLSDIEGLDLLIDAVRVLREKGWLNPVHIYGGGPAQADLVSRAAQIDGVVFKGAFKPEDARSIYAEVDIVVNPRRRSALTDKVTPLKPLEAMAYRKPVVVSSVAGMLELVREGETGFVFEADDQQALADVLIRVTAAGAALDDVVSKAYAYVLENRSWRANGLKYQALYSTLRRA